MTARDISFEQLEYTSIPGSQRPSALERSQTSKIHRIEKIHQKPYCFYKCVGPDLFRGRTADISEISTKDAAKANDVVSCTNNDRSLGNREARKAFRCCKKMKLTSEDGESGLDIIRLDIMGTATVDTLEGSSQSTIFNTNTPRGCQGDTMIEIAKIDKVENDNTGFRKEILEKEINSF